jgi:hypothetical protein
MEGMTAALVEFHLSIYLASRRYNKSDPTAGVKQ